MTGAKALFGMLRLKMNTDMQTAEPVSRTGRGLTFFIREKAKTAQRSGTRIRVSVCPTRYSLPTASGVPDVSREGDIKPSRSSLSAIPLKKLTTHSRKSTAGLICVRKSRSAYSAKNAPSPMKMNFPDRPATAKAAVSRSAQSRTSEVKLYCGKKAAAIRRRREAAAAAEITARRK